MAGWTVYVAFGFPIPLVLICLLTVPLPRPLAKPFLMFTNSLLGLKFVGSVPLLYFMIGLTGAAFAVNSASTWKAIDYPAGLCALPAPQSPAAASPSHCSRAQGGARYEHEACPLPRCSCALMPRGAGAPTRRRRCWPRSGGRSATSGLLSSPSCCGASSSACTRCARGSTSLRRQGQRRRARSPSRGQGGGEGRGGGDGVGQEEVGELVLNPRVHDRLACPFVCKLN
mmetsp:Transcript_60101/g.190923  ORF Transcript_60101/g.190923 Transcript_60101/m.190923 type:complete len:228 (-) Transcript_60101:4-687(-)